MTPLKTTSQKNILAERLSGLRDELRRKANPQTLAADSGAEFQTANGLAEIRLSLFGKPVRVAFPDLVPVEAQSGQPLPDALQALVLYYLVTADGAPLEGRWIAFADLPDGRFYNQAFQGYSGNELVKYFGDDLTALEQAARKLNGLKIAYGDAAFAFHVLPRLPLAVVYHLGDEDFPATCKILFDTSACHYLPTDVCAILGSMLTRKLLAA
ncbi:MAG: DUF3786 domain-containing protein [Anaerolineales bacterium]|nr:DUF3786 domain-containing protein [Anaerolineales bacterium]